ncbi:MAG: glycosyltransferase family 4 protein [Mycobacteriales bacterium]
MAGRPVRAAVYNRFWSTGGGAETYGGALAQLLARRGPVELIAHEGLDLVALGERLALDLSGCTVRVVPHTSRAVSAASRNCDLFVNVSHRSREASQAPRSLYVVHFPTSMGARTAPVGSPLPRVEWGPGFHQPEGRTTWTDGAGTLLVTTEPGRPVDLTLMLGFARPAGADPADVRVLVDGGQAATTRLGAARTPLERWSGRPVRVRVASPAAGVPAEVVVSCDGFVPADVVGGDDARTLGVPVVGVALGRGATARLTRGGLTPGSSTGWLDSYDALVANSQFTAGWVERLWQRPAVVLHPPVPMRSTGDKDQVILGVGRFFPRGRGHSKKQLELVQVFRRLVDAGLSGWTLHLVGGCSGGGRDYLQAVQAEAAGYPVELHVDASGAELDALYARAAIYWHVAGLGEDPARDPDRFEHFGISTVEAMSAGAVPVVLGAGGLLEIVRDGIDGLHIADLEQLAARTRELVEEPPWRRELASAAAQRARDFSLDAFDARLEELLEGL